MAPDMTSVAAASTTPGATDIPNLLRFLTQSAAAPLSDAMRLVPILQRASLTTPALIAATSLAGIRALLFPDDEKAAKQLHNAAKRVSGGGKRKKDPETQDAGVLFTTNKRRRNNAILEGEEVTPAVMEAELALPLIEDIDEALLYSTVLFTNRAPLLLAFTVILLNYTMPEQPLSSRLSLAQAMVSTGARARAITLGLEKNGAVEEGWGKGQPSVRVMGKEVKVLKRWGYEVGEDLKQQDSLRSIPGSLTVTNERISISWQDSEDGQEQSSDTLTSQEPALWGLDLEALKKSNGPPVVSVPSRTSTSSLPIYTPQSARAYLLKSFATSGAETTKSSSKKDVQEKARNLGFLLRTLDLLYLSWSSTLAKEELDRRAWTWYVAVRPDVEDGVRGWGGKGEVKLQKILDLRRIAKL